MAFLIGGANSAAVSGVYDIANSCRYNDDDSPYMHITPGSTGDEQKFTISFWFKRSTIGSGVYVLTSAFTGSNYDFIYFEADFLKVHHYNTGVGYEYKITTKRKFRDMSAWYHVVAAFDTTQGTAANRIKVYVNGTQETDLEDTDYPDQNYDTFYNVTSRKLSIGSHIGPGSYFDGYLAEVVMIDGTQYAASDFGEFDEDSPTIWKPKDVSGLTFGTNGFYLDFEASDNLGNDANGGTDLTEVNLAATDQTTDTPTNNFATTNPLNYGTNYTWSEGNLEVTQSVTNWDTTYSTIGVTSGKWYMEIKRTAGDHFDVGVTDVVAPTGNISQNSGCVAYKSNSEFARAGSTGGGLPSNVTDPASNTYAVDDIVSIALDVDNEAVYFAVNGTWEVNSDPESGASLTGATTLPNSGSTYFFAFAPFKGENSSSGAGQANFGNPPYANSSDAADADGYGAFEYAPPSGYYALCTKNLAEYG